MEECEYFFWILVSSKEAGWMGLLKKRLEGKRRGIKERGGATSYEEAREMLEVIQKKEKDLEAWKWVAPGSPRHAGERVQKGPGEVRGQ